MFEKSEIFDKIPIEDIFYLYAVKLINRLFPKNIPNTYVVYFFNFVHIIGTLLIYFGIFFPPYFMKLYVIYLLFIIASYYLLNNNCFMTILSNYIGDEKSSFIFIRHQTASALIFLRIAIAIHNLHNPKYSLYNMVVKSLKLLTTYKELFFNLFVFSFIIIIIICILSYFIENFIKKKDKNTKNTKKNLTI